MEITIKGTQEEISALAEVMQKRILVPVANINTPKTECLSAKIEAALGPRLEELQNPRMEDDEEKERMCRELEEKALRLYRKE